MSNEPVEVFDKQDIEKNKTMAGLAYILFFLPLISCPDSRFAKYHANQSLVLLLVYIAGSAVLRVIWFIGNIVQPFLSLAYLALAIIGLLNGINGKAQELPVIGKYRLLK